MQREFAAQTPHQQLQDKLQSSSSTGQDIHVRNLKIQEATGVNAKSHYCDAPIFLVCCTFHHLGDHISKTIEKCYSLAKL
jgi:hypothetical protein